MFLTLLRSSVVSVALLLSLPASAQTWIRGFEVYSNSPVSLSISDEGVSVAFTGAGTASHLTLDAHGDIGSFFREDYYAGEIRWAKALSTGDGAHVYAGTINGDPFIGRFDAGDGHEDWHQVADAQAGEVADACLTAAGTTIAIGTLDDDRPFVWAIDDGGSTLWRRTLVGGPADERVHSILALADGDVVFSSRASDGLRITRMTTSGQPASRTAP